MTIAVQTAFAFLEAYDRADEERRFFIWLKEQERLHEEQRDWDGVDIEEPEWLEDEDILFEDDPLTEALEGLDDPEHRQWPEFAR